MDHFIVWITLYGPVIMGWTGTVSLIASGIVAITPTPPPDSRFRSLYRAIEYVALVVGYAKDRGYLTMTAQQTRLADKAIELGKEVVNTTFVPAAAAPAPDTTADDKAKALADHIVSGLVAAGVVSIAAPPPAPPAPAPAPVAPLPTAPIAGAATA